MKKIYIPLLNKIPLHLQFQNCKTIIGDYQFILGGECKEADYVVILENILKPLQIRCNPGNVLLFTGEPPSVKSYPHDFLSQFAHIYTCQQNLSSMSNTTITYPALPWMLSCNFYDDSNTSHNRFNYFDPISHENRLNKICLFTSNKKFCKGHCDRIHFALELKKRLPDVVDIFGSGFEQVNNKVDELARYKYSIVIENSSYPYYWSEKLADTLLAETVPLYFGDPLIHQLFSADEVLDIDIFNIDEAVEKVNQLLNSNYYDEHEDFIVSAKEKVLYEYNMFPRIVKFVELIKSNVEPTQDITIYPQKAGLFVGYRTALRKKMCQKLPYYIIKHIL